MRSRIAFAFIIAACVANSASASLIGDTIHGTLFPDPTAGSTSPDPPTDPFNLFESAEGSGSTAVVGAGAEFEYDTGGLNILADFDAESLSIDFSWIGSGSGGLIPVSVLLPPHFLIFSDLDWVDHPGTIVGFDLTSPSISELSDFSFTGRSVSIEFGWIDVTNPGGFHLEFDLDVEHQDPVPEPATITLLGLSLAGLAFRRKMAA